MAQSKGNTNQQGDFHSSVTLLAGLIAAILYQEIGATVAFIYESNKFLIILLGMVSVILVGILLFDRYEKKDQRKYIRKSLLRYIGSLAENPDAIHIGETTTDQKQIYLNPEMRLGHVQILGATGRGKTASVIMPWFVRDLKNNTTPILIDGKGDFSIVTDITNAVSGLPKSISFFDPANPKLSCVINPLEGGSAHEVADRLFAALEFESVYFKEVQYTAVLTVLEAFESIGEVATLKGIYEALLAPQSLLERLSVHKGANTALTRDLMKICQIKADDREEKFSGIISQLRPFASGNFEKLVNSNGKSAMHVSLNRAMNPKLAALDGLHGLIILLPTMQYQKTAKVLGKLILQSLAWSTAMRDANQRMTPLFVDEFSAFVYEGFEQFLNKARSKGVALHLSHQSMGDLESVSPSFAKTINVNTNMKVLLGLNDPDTADYFARHLGTFTTTKETERASRGAFGSKDKSGELSVREVEEYKIHPNRLKSYSNGLGVISLIVHGQSLVEEIQFERRP